ncbi:MAG: hypothetical protein V7K41_27520 [Nostoc sp.]|uniref:hypothetical protein n=1 Tax=Nostoc sp. TaxID=1180 RepID=UPI002FF8A4C3
MGEQGAGSREQGAGNREQGAGSREQGAGSREQGAGSREQGAGSKGRRTNQCPQHLQSNANGVFQQPHAIASLSNLPTPLLRSHPKM